MSEQKSLTEIIENARAEDDGLIFETAPNWTQGRTAYGGFTAAILTAAVQKQHADLAPLRSAMFNFTAPISESPLIMSEVLRQGRNITTIAARALTGGKVAATGSFTFGHPQQSQIDLDLPAAPAPSPEDSAGKVMQWEKFPVPAFFHNFDMIPIEGDLPFSGSKDMSIRIWARHKDPTMRQGVASLFAIADFLPPAAMPRLTVPAMNSSVNWMCNILSDAPTTRDGWWLMESRLSAGHDGYSSQVMRVWNTDRQLVIDGMQSVVIFEQR